MQENPYTITTRQETASYSYRITNTALFEPTAAAIFEVEGSGRYSNSYDMDYNKTEQVDCTPLVKNQTRIDRAKVRDFAEGGHFKSTALNLTAGAGNAYTLQFQPPSIPFSSKGSSWRFYKGPCNPFSDTPAGGDSTPNKSWGNSSHPLVQAEGFFNPVRPNEIKGNKTYNGRINGLPATVTVTWDFKRQ